MYNKIFTKILDSSIWLEPTPTRIVWLTMLAAMDEDGFVQFASAANLSHRAILPLPETVEAIRVLESPDPNSSDPENEGRRIEKVPGGWMVLNAPKYRDMVTRVVIKEQTRKRVRAFREKKKCNADVTQGNENVTQSDTDTDTDTVPEVSRPVKPKREEETSPLILRVFALYNRKPSTLLNAKERKQAEAITDEDLTTVETAWRKKWQYHRQDISTLLNNWPAEVERAQNYLREIKCPSHGKPNKPNHPGSTFKVYTDAPEREDTSTKTGRLF